MSRRDIRDIYREAYTRRLRDMGDSAVPVTYYRPSNEQTVVDGALVRSSEAIPIERALIGKATKSNLEPFGLLPADISETTHVIDFPSTALGDVTPTLKDFIVDGDTRYSIKQISYGKLSYRIKLLVEGSG